MTSPLSGAERASLRMLASALEPFRTIRNALPLQYAQTFLAVALEPDSTINELSEATGVMPTATSRQVSDLGDINRYHRPGYGLVETKQDIMDRRFNQSRLTPAGDAMVGKVLRAMAA
jgi:DNA-binding MarR family transcriptional regulator